MGNNNSINITEKENGICQINVKDNINYPIIYLRLCKNPVTNDYCIAETCDINNDFLAHRKIIVVGFKVDDQIHEQVFYLSSGLNSIKSIEIFFKLKINKDINPDEYNLWIPFTGFGYDKYELKNIDDTNVNIKLLKDYFGLTGKYGRFGISDPNLMQISYCLGGKFWENNIDKFKKFKIEKLPTLTEYLNKKETCNFNKIFKNNIDCSVYLNKYIGYSLPQNYSEFFLTDKKKAFEKYKNYKWFNPNIKYDYRILYLILPNLGNISITNLENKKEIINLLLPIEKNFFIRYNWNIYLYIINNFYNKNKKIFEEQINPLFNEEKNIIDTIYKDTKLIEYNEKKDKETVSVSKFKLGTIDNPHSKRIDAKIGEYYLKGKLIVERRK